MRTNPPLFLCGAPQSSGSTLVSWCFLQRADTDGVLDARNDLLPDVPAVAAANAWCKFTVSAFRTLDVACHLADAGWGVRPLLVARDLRVVFDSLLTKPYGRNGVTAEEPPLRLRLRRFHRDWQRACREGWPVLRYESFVADPEGTLRLACEQIGLPWDPAMLTWPKDSSELAAGGHGSKTFRASRGHCLAETLRPELCAPHTAHIPEDDLRWAEAEFGDYNEALGYPPRLEADACPPGRAVPRYEVTRRYRHERRPLNRFRKSVARGWAQLTGRSRTRGE